MGAHFCSHLIKAASKSEAVKIAEAYQESERHENGHGAYSGHLGTAHGPITVDEKTFDSQEAACTYISETYFDKWEPPTLAKCGPDLWVLAGWCAS